MSKPWVFWVALAAGCTPETSAPPGTNGETAAPEPDTTPPEPPTEPPTEPDPCGDGLVQAELGEACDDGADNGEQAACLPDCTLASCGDGFLWDGVEGCEDGNTFGGDGCSQCLEPVRLDAASAADLILYGEPGDGLGQDLFRAGDLDGDGVDDLVVSATDRTVGGEQYAGVLHVFNGPIDTSTTLDDADARILGTDASQFVGFATLAADLTGDGVRDLSVATFDGIFVFYGPIVGDHRLDEADATIASGSSWGQAAGDVSGDGVDDLVVAGSDHPAVFVFHGPLAGALELQDADTTILVEDRSMPSDVAAGDLTGDGIADIVVGTYPVYGPDGGRVHVLDGPLAPEQSLATARATLTMPEIGGRVELGDFDGDGALEIVHPAGPVWVAPGSVVGPSDIATVAIAELGDQVWGVGVGDLNLDGRADVIVGEEQSVLPGRAYVVHGGLSGAVSFDQADLTLQSDDPGFGHSAAPIGDVNADGFEDFAVGSWRNSTAGTDAGAVWIMFGPHL